VLRTWFVAAAVIALGLLAAVTLIASLIRPDVGFHYSPSTPHGLEVERVLYVLGRNSLVLALHAVACLAGFIAGATLPLSAGRRTGLSRVIHEKARPIAFGWVVAVTCFSMATQAFALGTIGATIAFDEAISVPVLMLTAFPHAMLELTAVFLPLAAWTIASRRDEWDQLLAATVVTVALAIPMLIIAATWEVYVWPYILQAESPW
jgi:hypothetical protein